MIDLFVLNQLECLQFEEDSRNFIPSQNDFFNILIDDSLYLHLCMVDMIINYLLTFYLQHLWVKAHICLRIFILLDNINLNFVLICIHHT